MLPSIPVTGPSNLNSLEALAVMDRGDLGPGKVVLPGLSVSDSVLGIGIVTYNRLLHLKRCVERVSRLTRGEYRLVIADDGSSDGTREWCSVSGLSIVPVGHGENRGIAWNKNRALLYLLALGCDQVLLLEDDAWPREVGWDLGWRVACARWSHVNVVREWLRVHGYVYAGLGSPELPFHMKMCTAQCTITSRRALQEVGFLDPRFVGYGWEHVEWTRRFGLAGYYGGAHMLSIYGGIEFADGESWVDHPLVSSGGGLGQNAVNEALLYRLHEACRGGVEPIFRDAWLDGVGRGILFAELGLDGSGAVPIKRLQGGESTPS